MDRPADLGEFLRTRRARMPPEETIPAGGSSLRSPGLRREEVARRAGLGLTHYICLEEGRHRDAPPAVLEAIARVLRLDDGERAHLYRLAQPDEPVPDECTGQGVRHLMGGLKGMPAVALNHRHDVLYWNPLGHALLACHLDRDSPLSARHRPNLSRILFLDRRTRELYPQWADEARRMASCLRLASNDHPQDGRLAALIGELAESDAGFAALWSQPPVRARAFGTRLFRHPLVGRMELAFENVEPPDEPGQQVLVFSAEPDTESEKALSRLAARSAWPQEPLSQPTGR
jgi:transcription regulator MmyB-like protein/helix-turn-helix protein